ncbi:cytochrome P450 monooxygenase [Aspergillus pseudodeflectus]|uniref:Cytochrome P450 monooxygenase n=1 Tax=Aspergillus pseudodeflectus TaxID=176178 RepID=A0ABR4JKP8_9EURO
MLWLLLPTVILGYWLSTTGRPLYNHWRRARQLNLPIIISPIRRWGPAHRLLQHIIDRNLLPKAILRLPFVRVAQGSWTFREKFSIHQQYGKIFILASPTGCEIYVADAKAAKQILDRRNDFPKPNRLLARLEEFGRNLATVDGEEWQRHRRLTSKAFHEKTYRTVWDEAYSVASAMFRGWDLKQGVHCIKSDMATLSLEVLIQACFNLNNDKDSQATDATNVPSLQHHISRYLHSLTKFRPMPPAQEAGSHRRALSEFIRRLVENRKPTASTRSQNDLLSSMLAPAGGSDFSESEIAGNLFLFIFAGHETTASALVYIMHLLAIYPEWQGWATEEVDSVLASSTDDVKPDFHGVFPECKRIRAILYETLRLYGPVPTIVRQTASQDQILPCSNDTELLIPENTPINISSMALHTNPETWGEDALEWNPGRWIFSSNSSSESERGLSIKAFNSFFAWGTGPRVCPGQQFSQIEVVAVVVCLLRNYRVTIAPNDGEHFDDLRRDVLRLLQASRVGLTLQMPETAPIRLVRR